MTPLLRSTILEARETILLCDAIDQEIPFLQWRQREVKLQMQLTRKLARERTIDGAYLRLAMAITGETF